MYCQELPSSGRSHLLPHWSPDSRYPAGSLWANQRLQYNMAHRSNTGPVCRLKLVTLLFALSPELLLPGAGVKLQDNGYDELLIAINPRVPENQNLIANIKVSVNYVVNTISPLVQTCCRVKEVNPTRFELEQYRDQYFLKTAQTEGLWIFWLDHIVV